MILLTLSSAAEQHPAPLPMLHLSIPPLWSCEGSHNTHIVGITRQEESPARNGKTGEWFSLPTATLYDPLLS